MVLLITNYIYPLTTNLTIIDIPYIHPYLVLVLILEYYNTAINFDFAVTALTIISDVTTKGLRIFMPNFDFAVLFLLFCFIWPTGWFASLGDDDKDKDKDKEKKELTEEEKAEQAEQEKIEKQIEQQQ